MDDVVASNPKANLTDDVINTCVEFKISKPQAYGFTIILNNFRKKGRKSNTLLNNNSIKGNSPSNLNFLRKEARAITAII
jgi:hypothetical protein